MRVEQKRELIVTEMDRVLEAVYEAVRARVKHQEKWSRGNHSPSGVDLQQIQRELYNPDNGIVLTELTDTIVRDRLNRLIEIFKLTSQKMGREVVYFTPEVAAAREEWKQERIAAKKAEEDRVENLSKDLGYKVEWYSKAGYNRRQEKVCILIEDLEAIADKLSDSV